MSEFKIIQNKLHPFYSLTYDQVKEKLKQDGEALRYVSDDFIHLFQ